ncbi:MAG: hypothetical protein KDD40_09110, partial [Bdellovibrionales bacterium]|nr:hypothetical protein [Bdellovibrionales bacterium]
WKQICNEKAKMMIKDYNVMRNIKIIILYFLLSCSHKAIASNSIKLANGKAKPGDQVAWVNMLVKKDQKGKKHFFAVINTGTLSKINTDNKTIKIKAFKGYISTTMLIFDPKSENALGLLSPQDALEMYERGELRALIEPKFDKIELATFSSYFEVLTESQTYIHGSRDKQSLRKPSMQFPRTKAVELEFLSPSEVYVVDWSQPTNFIENMTGAALETAGKSTSGIIEQGILWQLLDHPEWKSNPPKPGFIINCMDALMYNGRSSSQPNNQPER